MAFAIAFWAVVGAAGGAAIGQNCRGRLGLGLLLGLMLGPLIGWPLIFLTVDHRRRCPQCRGVVQLEALTCEHCRADLSPHDARDPGPQPQQADDPTKIEGVVRWVSDTPNDAGFAAVIESVIDRSKQFAFLACLTQEEAQDARARLEQSMTFDRLSVRKVLPDRAASVAEIRRFSSATI